MLLGVDEDVFNNIPSWLGIKQASQTITADGSSTTAVDVTSAITEINATSATHACGLADGAEASIIVTHADGTKNTITGNTIDAETSLLIFDKKGTVTQIDVLLTPALS